MPFGYDAAFDVASLGTLTSASASAAQEGTGANTTFQLTVSSIGTNVVVRFEGSLDGTSYFNLDQSNTDTTLTANGTYGFALSGCPVKYVRFRVVSISGGSPSVSCLVGVM
jgi:hypothetical protein